MGRHAKRNVAQGSLSSLAAFLPCRGFGGAAHENWDYPICGAARTRSARKAAGPERGPCATLLQGHRARAVDNRSGTA